MKKNPLQMFLYLLLVAASAFLLLIIMKFGPSSPPIEGAAFPLDWKELVISDLLHNLSLPITGLLIQIFVILLASFACSAFFGLFGQTKVIGEIMAGLLLGKSVFAVLWPNGYDFVFPDSSLPRLYFLSQIGLIFFMFVVGLELNLKSVKKQATAAVMVSHASIVFPFLLGSLLSLFIFDDYAPAGVAFSSFALFMGIAMSITAFPVLARILKEKKLTHTPLGDMALTCAAVDDITAWFILAAVIGIVKAGSIASAAVVIALSLIYIATMIYGIGPFLEKKLRPRVDGSFESQQFAIVFLILLSSSLLAEIIGIHALFGAFLAGTIMPKNLSFRQNLTQRIEDISAVTLLPLFFAFTGIRTEIGLLSQPTDWLICALIIIIAIVGKLFGSAFAARWSGMNWSDSFSIGILMNTRGLMELIVLNIGYDLGLLSPQLFSMLVLMAFVTTLMTGPLLNLTRKSVLENKPINY